MDNVEEGVFFLTGKDFTNAGAASSSLKGVLEKRGVRPDIIRKTAIAAFEAEMNVIIYSVAGMMKYRITDTEISVTVQDMGQGIPNIELAMTEGYSTAPDYIREMGFGSGMGLPNIKKSTDSLVINSVVGEGTTLEFLVRLKSGECGE
jgi:anti-sigma regulatory factor (Ser/Thr protein kinase)